MNAVNLITMMFAAQGAATAKPQSTDQGPSEAGVFWQLQQQLLGDLGTAQLGASDQAADQIAAGLPELTVSLSPVGQLEAGSTILPTAAGEAAGAGQAWSLSELLAALLASLRQALAAVLPAGILQQGSTDGQGDATIDGGSTEPAAADGQSAAGAGDGQILPALIAAWSRIQALLNAKLTSQTQWPMTAQATPLRPAIAGQLTPAVPWSLRLQTQQVLQDGAAGRLTETSARSPLVADTGLLSDLPASVQWFKSIGLLGQQPAAVDNETAPAPVSAKLELPDGSQLLVRLTELAGSAADQQRSFAVSIELPGESATVLTATLTIRPVPPQFIGVGVDGGLQPTGSVPVTIATAGGVPGQDIAFPQAEVNVMQPEPAAAPDSKALELPVTQLAAEVAAQENGGEPVDLVPATDGKQRVTDQLLEGLKTTAVLESEVPAVQSQPAADAPTKGVDWTSQLALNQLGGLRQQPVEVKLQQPVSDQAGQLLPSADQSLGGDLVQAIAAPVSAETASPQLMEFVGSRLETAQYSGLEYLEMAERIMDRVATARSAGNGLYNAHLDLNPPSLGKMFVNISVRGDAVALQIAVATPVPKEQLKDSLEALRKSLEDEGLYVVELRVVQVNDDQDSEQRQTGHEQQDQTEQQAGQAVKTTPFLSRGIKSTPALDLSP